MRSRCRLIHLLDEGLEVRVVERGLEGGVELGAVADPVVALAQLRAQGIPRRRHGEVVERLVADWHVRVEP